MKIPFPLLRFGTEKVDFASNVCIVNRKSNISQAAKTEHLQTEKSVFLCLKISMKKIVKLRYFVLTGGVFCVIMQPPESGKAEPYYRYGNYERSRFILSFGGGYETISDTKRGCCLSNGFITEFPEQNLYCPL